MSIKQELLALQSADGMIHADNVVDWAKKHPKSELHKSFTWDDAKAADEYRLWQARRLIKLHIVNVEGEPEMISLSIDRPEGGGYRTVADVLSNRKLSAVMLQDALEALDRVREHYERVKELASVWTEVDRVRKRASQRTKRSSNTKAENRASM